MTSADFFQIFCNTHTHTHQGWTSYNSLWGRTLVDRCLGIFDLILLYVVKWSYGSPLNYPRGSWMPIVHSLEVEKLKSWDFERLIFLILLNQCLSRTLWKELNWIIIYRKTDSKWLKNEIALCAKFSSITAASIILYWITKIRFWILWDVSKIQFRENCEMGRRSYHSLEESSLLPN